MAVSENPVLSGCLRRYALFQRLFSFPSEDVVTAGDGDEPQPSEHLEEAKRRRWVD